MPEKSSTLMRNDSTWGGVGGKEETNFLELKINCVLKVVRVTQVYGFVRTNLAVLVRSVYFTVNYLQFVK